VSLSFFLNESRPEVFGRGFHGLQLSLNESAHGFHIFRKSIGCFVDRCDSMVAMLVFAEDAVCAQKFLFGLAVDRDVAVVKHASDGVVRAD
jgi:hypothetical protein